MSAVLDIGLGEQFDGDKVKAYPPGSLVDTAWQYLALPLGEIR